METEETVRANLKRIYIGLFIDEDLKKEIVNRQHKYEYKNQAEMIRQLIKLGLGCLDTEDQDKDGNQT